jgi:uncharacterized FAD-dependent dehydrogenase
MSHSARSGHYANAAIVTPLLPDEMARHGEGVLAGVAFQDAVERAAYRLGGGEFRAPASRLVDYVAGRGSSEVRRTTFRRGVTPADLAGCYSESIHGRIRAALRRFDQKMRGFLSEEAVIIGVETRTSAPVRILRDERMRSISHRFLYPGGEGAGLAGGIVSAAVDGVRIGRAILASG